MDLIRRSRGHVAVVVRLAVGLVPVLTAVDCRAGGHVPNDTAVAEVQPAPVDSPRPSRVDTVPVQSRDLVVITMRRESLGVKSDAPLVTVRAAMLRGLEALKRATDFEILEVSPTILAARVRAPKGSNAAAVAARLRREPAVAAAEVEGFAKAER